jgi:NAD(P)H-nitrite reductase large subunit/ferredoxin
VKKVYVNEEWCLGCHLCEYYCAFANSNEKDMSKALKNAIIHPRIQLEEGNNISFAVSCRHCDDPLCVKENIQFILKTQVTKFLNNKALLSNGEEIDFDVLVLAVGVRPNVNLIRAIDGKANRGIVVDEFCQTSLSYIYAAGDCCESYDITTDQNRVLALLPNAYMMGECAGINMTGGEKVYDKAIPMNSIGFLGLHMVTAGSYDGEVYILNEPGHYKKIFVKGGFLKGYIIIGNIEKAGIYTSLIRERIPLSDIDFELICSRPSLMAFSKIERKKKLGGAIHGY